MNYRPMKRIYKYPLEVTDVQTVRMPRGARVLCAQNQGGTVTLWAEVDPNASIEQRTFRIFGTGHTMPDVQPLVYIGSVLQPPFMWHVYEEENK